MTFSLEEGFLREEVCRENVDKRAKVVSIFETNSLQQERKSVLFGGGLKAS